jgi:hypothetical protein
MSTIRKGRKKARQSLIHTVLNRQSTIQPPSGSTATCGTGLVRLPVARPTKIQKSKKTYTRKEKHKKCHI